MELSIIIVSYNTKKLIKELIASIPRKKNWEVIVVDNVSQDGSVEMIKNEFPQIKIIVNRENVGFAKANNQAMGVSTGDFVLLLNPDTILKHDSIEKLLSVIKKDEKVGIASGQLLNQDGSIQPHGGYLPGLMNIFFWMFFIDDLPFLGDWLKAYHINNHNFFKQTRNMGWVGGTAMMIRRELLETVGKLNEDFFMYGEDVEYCMRAVNKGYKIIMDPSSRITHLQHKSSGGFSFARLGEYKAIKYIFRKYKPAWQYRLIKIILKSGSLLRMLVFGILQGRKDAYETYKKAYRLV